MGPRFNSTKYHTLEGEWNEAGDPFKWKFNTQNPFDSTISVWIQGEKRQIKDKDIQWTGTEKLLPQTLSKMIRKSTDRFSIVFSPSNNPTTCHITLNPQIKSDKSFLEIDHVKEFVPLLSEESADPLCSLLVKAMAESFIKAEEVSLTPGNFAEIIEIFEHSDPENQEKITRKVIDAYTIKDMGKIVRYLQQRNTSKFDSLIQVLLRGIMNCFMEKTLPNNDQIQEVIELFEEFNAEDKKRFLEKIIATFGVISDVSMFEKMTEAFKRLLKMSYRLPLFFDLKELPSQEEKEVFSRNSLSTHDPLKTLSPSNIISLINLTVDSLNQNGHVQDVKALTCYLVCVNALMEIALNNNVGYVAKEAFDEFYKSFKERTEQNWGIRWKKHADVRHADFYVSFLAHSAIQSLKLMKSDESKKYTILRHTIYALRFVAKAANHVSLSEPWHALGIIEELPLLGKAVKFKDLKKAEFVRLSLLKKAYLGGGQASLNDFAKFVEDIQSDAQHQMIEKKLGDSHNHPRFVLGLIDLLQMMMETYATEHPRTYHRAKKLLGIINQNNSSSPVVEQKKKIWFKVDDQKQRQDIYQRLTSLLENLPSQTDQKTSTSPITPSSNFYPSALKSKAPWIEGMRQQRKNLKNDSQLIEEGPYAIDLHATKVAGQPKQELENSLLEHMLEELLENKKNFILLLGEAGSGKTLFLKKYILNYLEHYHPSRPLPLYIPLNELENPQKNLIEESLKLYGLQDYQEELKKRPTIWFLDAYDEVFIGNQKQHFNIYKSNSNLKQWKQAQFVYTCRPDTLGVGGEKAWFAPDTNTPVELLHICPFEESDIATFFDQYVPEKRKKNAELQITEVVWEAKEYVDEMKELGLNEMAKNPFILKSLADILPMLNKIKTENEIQISKETTRETILDEWICYLIFHHIKREYEKSESKSEILITPVQYFDFALEVSRYMEICGNKSSFSLSALSDANTRTAVGVYIENQKEAIKRHESTLTKLKEEQKNLTQLSADQTEKKEALQRDYQKRIEREHGEITKCRECIDTVNQAISELRQRLFEPKYSNLRRTGLFQKKFNGEEGFIHLLVYERLRKIDKDEGKKERLTNLLNQYPIDRLLENFQTQGSFEESSDKS